MDLKIIVPTHIWEFAPIQKQWFNSWSELGGSTSIIHEAGEAPSGRNVRQKHTDILVGKNVYVHFLDNDNLIPYEVLQFLENIFSKMVFDYNPKIFMFAQKWWADGPLRLNAKPENCVPAKCDIAQLFVYGKFLKDMTWSGDYENDGQFIQELYKRYPDDFVFINDVFVWYNALKPNTGLYQGQVIEIA